MTQQGRRRLLDWKAVVGIIISAGLLFYIFRKQNVGELITEIRGADPLYFFLATFCATFVFWIRAWRWKTLLESVKPGTPFHSRFASTMIGFMGNNIFPMRAGEVMRAYALTRMERIPIAASIASLAIERLLDGITILVMLFVSLLMVNVPMTATGAQVMKRPVIMFTLVVGAILVFIVTCLVFPKFAIDTSDRMGRLLPEKARAPLNRATHAFIAGLDALRDPVVLVRAGAWSIGLWLFNALGFWFAFQAFDLHLNYVAAIFFQCALVAAVAVPAAPGFWGVYEGMSKIVLVGLWGYDATRANAFAVSYHLAGYIPVTVIGLYYAWRVGVSPRTVEEAVPPAVPASS